MTTTVNSANREAVEKRLAWLAENGRLTPEAVVEDAKNPDSPLHAEFDWNDETAAYKHRVEHARGLIRSVHYQFVVENHTITSVAYVHDPRKGNEQGYIPVARVRSDRELAKEAMVAEVARASAALERARALAAVFGLAPYVETLIAQLNALRDQLGGGGTGARETRP